MNQTKTLPGNTGLPLIGETLSYINNPFGFLEDRVQSYGSIYKTSLLGRKTVVISGPESCEILLNKSFCKRDKSMPGHVQQLFGGKSLPLLDAENHIERKKAIMLAFSPEALESYLPEIQSIVESSFKALAEKDSFDFVAATKQLSIEIICSNIFGLKNKADLNELNENYQALTKGFTSLPLNLTGTTFNKALKAREKIFKIFERVIAEHHKNKSDDGLSRIMNSSAKLADEDIKLEMHHIVIAGYIVFAEFITFISETSGNSEVSKKLKDEISNFVQDKITIETIKKMPYLNQSIMETKRLCPVVPNVFSIANQTFEFKGFTVPKDYMVIWALRSTNIDKDIYPNPLKFDPERFSDERAEHKKHKYAYVPQGAGEELDHRCAGLDYTTYLMATFIIVLLKDYKWQLKDVNPEYNWSMLPPEPKHGLKVKLEAIK